jgi:NAD(P)-dependent dehydrogenase (short-subunit alcohol dehydrogenase family)
MTDMRQPTVRCRRGFGRVDILVNNAARAIGGVVDEIDEDSWNEVITTNLTSVWRGIRCVAPLMRKQGGGLHREPQLRAEPARLSRLGGLRCGQGRHQRAHTAMRGRPRACKDTGSTPLPPARS